MLEIKIDYFTIDSGASDVVIIGMDRGSHTVAQTKFSYGVGHTLIMPSVKCKCTWESGDQVFEYMWTTLFLLQPEQ